MPAMQSVVDDPASNDPSRAAADKNEPPQPAPEPPARSIIEFMWGAAATALATKVSEAEAGTTRLRFPQERPNSRL